MGNSYRPSIIIIQQELVFSIDVGHNVPGMFVALLLPGGTGPRMDPNNPATVMDGEIRGHSQSPNSAAATGNPRRRL